MLHSESGCFCHLARQAKVNPLVDTCSILVNRLPFLPVDGRKGPTCHVENDSFASPLIRKTSFQHPPLLNCCPPPKTSPQKPGPNATSQNLATHREPSVHLARRPSDGSRHGAYWMVRQLFTEVSISSTTFSMPPRCRSSARESQRGGVGRGFGPIDRFRRQNSSSSGRPS